MRRCHSSRLAAVLAALALSSNLQRPCSNLCWASLNRTSLNIGSSSPASSPTSRTDFCAPASSSFARLPLRNRSTRVRCALINFARNVSILSEPMASSSKSARISSSSLQYSGHCSTALAKWWNCTGTFFWTLESTRSAKSRKGLRSASHCPNHRSLKMDSMSQAISFSPGMGQVLAKARRFRLLVSSSSAGRKPPWLCGV